MVYIINRESRIARGKKTNGKKNKGTDLRQKEGEAYTLSTARDTRDTPLKKKEEVHNITLQDVYLILYSVMLYELSHSIFKRY